ncbi:SDR family oxidoreductase [Vineibacter terrae]|uniref:SDR family oxidoreductase n=1 Tax=Vineibacter terrae TaxID=2586908 RepID=UPI002E2F101E|nr:SDR family oxidoreductase [Vineibacter terrae]HEX2886889.1 SDR family oxidoreductase [Vineibacter terrae]
MVDRTVLVAGASGIVGRAAVARFAAAPGTQVIALSRRPPDLDGAYRFLPLDLTDADACTAAAAGLGAVTHVVFTALYEKPGLIRGWRDTEQMQTNLAMLQNLMRPLLDAAPALRHVTLLQGTKAYGAHLRPIRVPARERWPRDDHANFYWLQEDWLRAAQKGRDWTFTILRPQIIFGHGMGSPMNMLSAIGAYAAILKARGEPLHWPGGPGYLAEAVCADLLARAIDWAGTSPAAAGETFNVTNGDVFSWHNVWPAIAQALGTTPGAARPLRLAQDMPACEAEWAAVVQRHGLRSGTLKQFVGDSFFYADFSFAHGRELPPPPALVSTVKIRQAGFADCLDTEDMFAAWFAALQRMKLLPAA